MHPVGFFFLSLTSFSPLQGHGMSPSRKTDFCLPFKKNHATYRHVLACFLPFPFNRQSRTPHKCVNSLYKTRAEKHRHYPIFFRIPHYGTLRNFGVPSACAVTLLEILFLLRAVLHDEKSTSEPAGETEKTQAKSRWR